MKLADVLPLFKSGNHSILNNYRPISLLPTISKLLEKIMYNRTYEFLDEHNIFFKSQYGFRKKHSFEHAITELIGEICKGFESNKHTLSIFIDLSKAFDTISHEILFQKLERYGITGLALEWYKSYLNCRKLRAKCNTATSNKFIYSKEYDLEIGTPEGSCLGPLIFLIFCNDLYLNLELCSGILFADDTTIYKSHSNIEFLKWCMVSDMEIIIDWFKANHLSLNENKTVCILFSKDKTSIDALTIGDITVKSVQSTTFLGVNLDHKLTWKIHIVKLICKIKKNINLLRCGNNFLNIHTKRLIYYAHLQSHISYGLSIWGNMIPPSSLHKIQKLQNKCVELINGNKATSTNLKSLRILKVKDLLKLDNCKFGFKLIHNLLPTRIVKLAKHDITGKSLVKDHKYKTRQISLLNKPQAKKKAYRNCIIYIGTGPLETLKAETLQKPSLQSFVNSCKKELFDTY